jgi:hypothetical protein
MEKGTNEFIARIYISGPYTKDDPIKNVENATMIADQLADLGFAPYTPHFTHYWHINYPRPYDFWSKLHHEFLQYCDAVLRIPGESIGADEEVKKAYNLKIPVFYSVEELKKHYIKSS